MSEQIFDLLTLSYVVMPTCWFSLIVYLFWSDIFYWVRAGEVSGRVFTVLFVSIVRILLYARI